MDDSQKKLAEWLDDQEIPAEAVSETPESEEPSEPEPPKRTALEQVEDALVTTLGGLCGTVAGLVVEFDIDGFAVTGLGVYLVKAIIGAMIGFAVFRLLFWGSLKAMGKTERPFRLLR